MGKYYSYRRKGKTIQDTLHNFTTLSEAEKYGEIIQADELVVKTTTK